MDKIYLNRVVSVFNNKYSDKLEIYSFSNAQKAIECVNNNRIDVFLVSSQFDFSQQNLSDKCGFAYLVDSPEIETVNGKRTICKFQKAELIYKEILGIFSEYSSATIGLKISETDTHLIMFISPAGGVGTTTVATACAISIAQKGKKTLMLNLNPFDKTDSYFRAEGQFGFSDVLYAIKSKKSNFALKLESTVKHDDSGVYFYESPKMAMDMLDMRDEELAYLIEELKTVATYQYIVLDVPFAISQRVVDLMKQSEQIVCVTDGTDIGNSKFDRAYEAWRILEDREDNKFLKRMNLIYNKFSNKSGKSTTIAEVGVLGGSTKIEQATPRQIAIHISQLQVFDKFVQ